jgi:carboxyl-terminal processing protease
MSASLRNNDRAIFVGQRTFGKGTVQKTYALGTDEALKLTVGNFLPKGLAIPAGGLVPDVEIRTLFLTTGGYRLSLARPSEDKMEFWQRNPAWLTVEPARTPVVLSFLRDVTDAEETPAEGEDDEADEVLPDEPLEDPAVAVADEILRRFGSTSASRMLVDAAAFLAERSQQATADLARALSEKGIDWSAGEPPPAATAEPKAVSDPDPGLRVELDSGSRVLRAGVEGTLELRVTNSGTRPAHRVLAVLESEIGFLRGLGALFGRIEPGASVTRTIAIKPPVELRLALLPVDVVVENDSGPLGHHGPYWLVVEEAERPILAHRADVSRGEAADVVELHVQIANRGKADSGEIRLQLQQPETGIAELLEGTTTFPPLAPGATVDTRLHVKLLTSSAEAPTVNLVIVDTLFRGFAESKVRLVEAEGRWLEPPRITLSRFEKRGDGERPVHTIVAAVTDDNGIAQVRASIDGDRVAFVDLSGRPTLSRTVELPWTIGEEAKRYEIIATDADGLVERYVTEM